MNEQKPLSLEEALARKWIEHLEGYLNDAKAIIKTYGELPPEEKLEIPNMDLHVLEHDPVWMSFKKDKDGRCTFPAEENKAGWARLKNVPNDSPILKLVKAMGRNKIEKVSVGLFEYRLSANGEFLQRRPLKKPEESSSDPHVKMEKNIQNAKEAGQKLLS